MVLGHFGDFWHLHFKSQDKSKIRVIFFGGYILMTKSDDEGLEPWLMTGNAGVFPSMFLREWQGCGIERRQFALFSVLHLSNRCSAEGRAATQSMLTWSLRTPEGEGGWNGLTLLTCHSAFYQHPFPSNPHFYIKSDYLLMMSFIRVFVYYLPLFLKIEARWKPKPCVIHCRGPASSSETCCWVGIK